MPPRGFFVPFIYSPIQHNMKLLLIILLLVPTLLWGQQKPSTDIYVFKYKLDSVWIGKGPLTTPMAELYKQGYVTPHYTQHSTIEIQFSQADDFKDRILFIDSLLKLRDTLYVAVQSHLAGATFISLRMLGWLHADKMDGPHDFHVEYIINHDVRMVVVKEDTPDRRALYFIHAIDNYILPKK